MAHPCQNLQFFLEEPSTEGALERRVRVEPTDDDARGGAAGGRRRRRAERRQPTPRRLEARVPMAADDDTTRVKVVRRRGQFIEGEAREASATSTTARHADCARHATIAVELHTLSVGVGFTHRVPVAVEDLGCGGAVGPASAVGRAAVLLDQVCARHVPLVFRPVHRRPPPHRVAEVGARARLRSTHGLWCHGFV